MTDRPFLRTGVRLAVGVVSLAVGAGVIAAATLVPLPSLTETPAGRVVTPVALDQQRVCAGSLLRLAGDAGASATTVTAAGAATAVTAAGSGDAPESTNLAGADGANSLPQVVTSAANGSTTVPIVAGSQSQQITSNDLTGFAASSCQEPTSSTWLVGGSTETGRTTLIDLVNPSDVNSTVDLQVFGESGKVEGPGLKGIVVAPRSQKSVPLSGFATGLTSPVVHVTSRGGQVSSSLQVGIVRTLTPGGVDVVSAAAAPSKALTVPGIVVRDGEAIQNQAGQDGYGDLVSAMRVFVPGSGNAQVTIQMRTASGTGSAFTVTAQGGQVTDVPLDGLADGLYTASVRSTTPVVAGVRTSSVSSDGVDDLAWVGAAPTLHGTTMFTVAPGPSPEVTLANPTGAAIVTKLSIGTGPKASTKSITIPADGSVSVKFQQNQVGTLRGGTGLHAALSYAGAGSIAAYALFSPAAVSSPVTVYP